MKTGLRWKPPVAGRKFGTDEACRRMLFRIRWPGGFRCPRCGGERAWPTGRGLWLCAGCRRQVSILSGTALQGSHVSPSVWLRAIWHVTARRDGISARELQRVLGLRNYRTAWRLLHRIRRAMARGARDRLKGRVEVDQIFWGHPRSSQGSRTRGEKVRILIAATEEGKRTVRIRLGCAGRGRAAVHGFLASAVEPGSVVLTRSLRFGRDGKGSRHGAVTCQRRRELPRVHRVAALLQRWLSETYRGAPRSRHLAAYLGEFVFRFNGSRSVTGPGLFKRLLERMLRVDAASLKPGARGSFHARAPPGARREAR